MVLRIGPIREGAVFAFMPAYETIKIYPKYYIDMPFREPPD